MAAMIAVCSGLGKTLKTVAICPIDYRTYPVLLSRDCSQYKLTSLMPIPMESHYKEAQDLYLA